MKTTVTLLMLCALFLPNSLAQEYTRFSLPEGAKVRFGKGEIFDIQYSPDGTRLAVASSIGIWLYDTKTYQETDLIIEHTDQLTCLAFNSDGTVLAAGTYNGPIHLWNVVTGEEKKTLTGDRGRITTVVFSPDGNTLASNSTGDTVRLWDVTTGEEKKRLTGHTYSGRSIAFSPDGNTLATSSPNSTVRLWDVMDG